MTIDLAKLTNLNDAARAKVSTKPPETGRWYDIKNLATDTAEIYLYAEIGGWGVTSADFIAELRDLRASAIELHINSPGGSVFDGIAIFTALMNHPAKVTSVIDAIAASAASFIAMAGEEIVMEKHSRMMIHDASGFCWGMAKDMRETADLLDALSDTIAEVYTDRAGSTIAEWRAIMSTDTWYTASEAVAAGLADRVAESKDDTLDARTPMQPVAVTPIPAPTPAPNPEPVPNPEPEFDMHAFHMYMLTSKLIKA